MKPIEKRAIEFFDKNKPALPSEYRVIQLMKKFAAQEVNNALQEAADKIDAELITLPTHKRYYAHGEGLGRAKEIIKSIQTKDQ